MPRMGTCTSSCMALATTLGTHSTTMANTPAASRALASSISFRADSGVPPCTLKPPKEVAVCGVIPMWPITLMPASTIARIVGAMFAPPSSFTQSHRVSLVIRLAVSMACSLLTL